MSGLWRTILSKSVCPFGVTQSSPLECLVEEAQFFFKKKLHLDTFSSVRIRKNNIINMCAPNFDNSRNFMLYSS